MKKFKDLQIGDYIYYEYDCRLIGKCKIIDIEIKYGMVKFINDSNFIIEIYERELKSSESGTNHYQDENDYLAFYSDKKKFIEITSAWLNDINKQFEESIK